MWVSLTPTIDFFLNALYVVLFKKHVRGVGVNRGISSSTQLLLSCKLILCERENSKGSASLEMLLCILFTAMSADFPANAGYTEWFPASPSELCKDELKAPRIPPAGSLYASCVIPVLSTSLSDPECLWCWQWHSLAKWGRHVALPSRSFSYLPVKAKMKLGGSFCLVKFRCFAFHPDLLRMIRSPWLKYHLCGS